MFLVAEVIIHEHTTDTHEVESMAMDYANPASETDVPNQNKSNAFENLEDTLANKEKVVFNKNGSVAVTKIFTPISHRLRRKK